MHFTVIFCDVIANFMLLELQIAVKEIELSEEIGSAVVNIAKEIGRWEAYLRLYPVSSRLHRTIAELFAQVINFAVRAMKFYEMTGPRISP
jgi:hypothetical protein